MLLSFRNLDRKLNCFFFSSIILSALFHLTTSIKVRPNNAHLAASFNTGLKDNYLTQAKGRGPSLKSGTVLLLLLLLLLLFSFSFSFSRCRKSALLRRWLVGSRQSWDADWLARAVFRSRALTRRSFQLEKHEIMVLACQVGPFNLRLTQINSEMNFIAKNKCTDSQKLRSSTSKETLLDEVCHPGYS